MLNGKYDRPKDSQHSQHSNRTDWPNQKKREKEWERRKEMNKKNKKCQTESILRMNTQTNSIMQAIQSKLSMENARARNGCWLVGWLDGRSSLFPTWLCSNGKRIINAKRYRQMDVEKELNESESEWKVKVRIDFSCKICAIAHGAHHQCASVITNQRSQQSTGVFTMYPLLSHGILSGVVRYGSLPLCTFCSTRARNIFLFGIFVVYGPRVRQSEESQWIIARIQLNNNDWHLRLRAKRPQNFKCIQF